MSLSKTIGYSFLILGMACVVAVLFMSVEPVQGGVIQGQEYNSTSTGATNINGEIVSGESLLGSRFGSLGSVVITGDATGLIHFYDATTSDATARVSTKSTSTIHIGSVAPSAPEGTYVFDVQYSDGLLMVIEGTAPSSTITYR